MKDDPSALKYPEDAYSAASKSLGMQVSFFDAEKGIVEASFQATEEQWNFVNKIHGGFITAMLDDLMGYALGISLPKNEFAPTANMKVSFLRPADAGVLHGRGQILKRENNICTMAAKLYNESNELLASATATAKLGVSDWKAG